MELRLLFEPASVRYLTWVVLGWLLAAFLFLGAFHYDGFAPQIVLVTCTSLGLLGAWVWDFQVRSYQRLMSEVPPARYRDVYRAITRGPLPESRELRSAALAVAQRYLKQAMPGRRFSIGMSVFVVAICVFNAWFMNRDGSVPNLSAAWLAVAALWAYQAVQKFHVPRLVRARVALLTSAELEARA
ncbi:hypothetical protein [Mycobacterium sp. NPDC050853]|uniref:hypothetical protein n=1 Tax=Mycobacterium sp. NPDC050853 TaxID=3155160 RepID=UPI0033F20F5F